MTLEEAIKHAEEVADICEYEASKYDMSDSYESYVAGQEGKCAEEHRQLAEWLKDYQRLLDNRCKQNVDTIKTLDQEPKTDTWSIKDVADTLAKHGLISEQEPCEDYISREHLLEEIASLKESPWFKDDTNCAMAIRKEAIEIVEDLCIRKEPSVNPQRIGHWIIEKWNNKEHYSCSSCQHVVDYEPCYHYCPYCGAKMVEPQESEGT